MNSLFVILILSSSLLVSVAPGSNARCKLSKKAPDFEKLVKAKRNVATLLYESLANMVGLAYVREIGYMPLVLSGFRAGDARAAFWSECASLTWEFPRANQTANGSTKLGELTLELMDHDADTTYTCVVKTDRTKSLDDAHRLSCKGVYNTYCATSNSHGAPVVADITWFSIEFELNGNREMTKYLEFSKPRSIGCDIFGYFG